jgi:nucleoredoxin
VHVNNGELKPYDSSKLNNKKYLAIYFSASWCPPCREFTPSLVQWYARAKAGSDDFELILVSSDRDEASMKSYMLDDHMAWPAVAFKSRENNPLVKYKGRGIPSMVILDSSGIVVSSSFIGGEYFGPQKPLEALEQLLRP